MATTPILGVTPTPAANARSPNRKPRVRNGWRTYQRTYARQAQQDAVIAGYLQGQDREAAAAGALATPILVANWEQHHPEFRERAAKAREIARLRAGGQLDDALSPLIRRLRDMLEHTKNEKAAIDGILSVLRGRGVLVDRQESEVKGVILSVSADDLAKIYRASREQLLSPGGEPLGVADGGGNGERPTSGAGADTVPAVAPSALGAKGDKGT